MLYSSLDAGTGVDMLKSFLVGGFAGALAKTLIAPFDRVKIMFQISNVPFTYRGVLLELQRTWRMEGFTALFKGNTAQVLRVYPYSGTQLMAYDEIARVILAMRRAAPPTPPAAHLTPRQAALQATRLSPMEKLCAGAAAGAVSVVVTYPLDLMRARLAVQTMHDVGAGGAPRFTSIMQAFRSMYAEHGALRFYRGMAPTLAGMAPYAGISFATNETLKQAATDANDGVEPSSVVKFLCGGVAGLAGQGATYPLDVVRRRMQTEGFTIVHAHTVASASHHVAVTDVASAAAVPGGAAVPATPASSSAGGGIIVTTQRILAQEGYRGLFKGFSMNLVKGPLGVGFSFTLYDILKKALHVAPAET